MNSDEVVRPDWRLHEKLQRSEKDGIDEKEQNRLFSTSVKGADASAWIYSVIVTAYENGVNVQDYLTNLFKNKSNELPF